MNLNEPTRGGKHNRNNSPQNLFELQTKYQSSYKTLKRVPLETAKDKAWKEE